jgi:hypothetical protein
MHRNATADGGIIDSFSKAADAASRLISGMSTHRLSEVQKRERQGERRGSPQLDRASGAHKEDVNDLVEETVQDLSRAAQRWWQTQMSLRYGYDYEAANTSSRVHRPLTRQDVTTLIDQGRLPPELTPEFMAAYSEAVGDGRLDTTVDFSPLQKYVDHQLKPARGASSWNTSLLLVLLTDEVRSQADLEIRSQASFFRAQRLLRAAILERCKRESSSFPIWNVRSARHRLQTDEASRSFSTQPPGACATADLPPVLEALNDLLLPALAASR